MFRLLLGVFWRFFRSRRDLVLENLALRQQLLGLQRRRPRARPNPVDLLFWVVTRWLWPKWKQALLMVRPETVIRWRRTGFRLSGIGFPAIVLLWDEREAAANCGS